MHKLLQRQLNKFLDDEAIIAIERNPDLLLAISQAYEQADQDQKMTERSLDLVSQEMTQRNQSLSDALKHLQETQTQLVEAEKMASIGEMVAGIAHEVNTPTGAIINTIEGLKGNTAAVLLDCFDLLRTLPPEGGDALYRACNEGLESLKAPSTKESRGIARELRVFFDGHGFEMSRNLSAKLASVGYRVGNAEHLLPLVGHDDFARVCELVYEVRVQHVLLDDASIAASRIANLVRALKLYAHSDHDDVTEASFDDDINNTLVILQNKLKQGVIVEREFSEIPLVLCHADELNQVWTNIINNAIHAMNGKGRLTIRLYSEANDCVALEFEDNGPGIQEKIVDRIFEPYFTTKKRGEGTGLGLSICKKILDKHGASISVESVPGSTVFKIVVPVHAVCNDSLTLEEEENGEGGGNQ